MSVITATDRFIRRRTTGHPAWCTGTHAGLAHIAALHASPLNDGTRCTGMVAAALVEQDRAATVHLVVEVAGDDHGWHLTPAEFWQLHAAVLATGAALTNATQTEPAAVAAVGR